MVDNSKLEKYKRRLDMQHGFHNCSNKIWILWNNDITVDIIMDKEQHVHFKVTHNNGPGFFLTVVYAKCTEDLRTELWSDMKNILNYIQEPWGVFRDFNVITTSDEKKGGRCYIMEESLDFIECLNECGLQDAGFIGSIFTWCDNRDPPSTIWKRLDRMVYNSAWFDTLNATTVTHLSRACSDHAPLVVKINNETTQHIKYFKFLNFWTDHHEYIQTVQNAWEEEVIGNPINILHQKLKRTSNSPSTWSRQTFGDIFEEPKRLEAQLRILEDNCVKNNTPDNRCELSRCKAEFTRYLKIQNSMLRQKARIKWLDEGDSNTAYFHGIIKDNRRKLAIRKIKDDQNQWLEGNDAVVEGAIRFYQQLFTQDNRYDDFSSLNCLERCIFDEDNSMLTDLPSLQEAKNNVFSIDADSSLGPDGFSGCFYQKTWQVIGHDVHKVVAAFFNGATLPKFFSHTCLVMVPKVDHPQ
ncbi:PREDICTED: uncharacterized protein LOC109230274 [Nicotiana attenuata]|uniref:uncharacterized protein LOC109230274 n=1 Tax=Nicotiana attenuata TaxID=49451 RepID=UPI000905CCD3|nr:PREDICTED: uncharacterized protein LOC109230274 [Nicotiana attenuata]